MDFVSDQLADWRRFRVLNIVDDHSLLCPGQIVDVSIPGACVARFLDDLAFRTGLPEEIILDNGPESQPTRQAIRGQLSQVPYTFHRVVHQFDQRQYAIVEAFDFWRRYR